MLVYYEMNRIPFFLKRRYEDINDKLKQTNKNEWMTDLTIDK